MMIRRYEDPFELINLPKTDAATIVTALRHDITDKHVMVPVTRVAI